MIGLHLVAQAGVVGAVGVHELDPGPDHEELADLFLQRHFVQGASAQRAPVGSRATNFLAGAGLAVAMPAITRRIRKAAMMRILETIAPRIETARSS